MKISVDVVSDVVCPWCFVGKRRIEKAIRALGGAHQVELTWRPFELNPDLPREGAERTAYRVKKFGSLERSRELEAQMRRVGESEGIAFTGNPSANIPNTRDAHRLLAFALAHGQQDAVCEALFEAYFVEGADLGRVEELARIAGRAGLDAAEVAAYLHSTAGAEEVRTEEARYTALGVSGVPFFIVDGTLALSGAQPPEVFLQAFQQAVDARGGATAVESAEGTCRSDKPDAC
jgi:predicted DsbA family dithiol-disulfide isomerase